MKYIDLKAVDNSSMHISRIGMGSTMSMEMLSTSEKHRLYDCYLDHGGNLLDTARAYSGGHAEEMVAEYLKASGKRNRIILCTKGGHPTDEHPEISRVSREEILSDLETSLKTPGTDYVDFYWIHKDDPSHSIENIVDTVNIIIKQGKARKVGLSNFTEDRMKRRTSTQRKVVGVESPRARFSARPRYALFGRSPCGLTVRSSLKRSQRSSSHWKIRITT